MSMFATKRMISYMEGLRSQQLNSCILFSLTTLFSLSLVTTPPWSQQLPGRRVHFFLFFLSVRFRFRTSMSMVVRWWWWTC